MFFSYFYPVFFSFFAPAPLKFRAGTPLTAALFQKKIPGKEEGAHGLTEPGTFG